MMKLNMAAMLWIMTYLPRWPRWRCVLRTSSAEGGTPDTSSRQPGSSRPCRVCTLWLAGSLRPWGTEGLLRYSPNPTNLQGHDTRDNGKVLVGAKQERWKFSYILLWTSSPTQHIHNDEETHTNCKYTSIFLTGKRLHRCYCRSVSRWRCSSDEDIIKLNSVSKITPQR